MRLCQLGWLALVLAAQVAAAEREPTLNLPAQGRVELAFSPWNDPEQALLEVIDGAREQILVQAYLFTSKPLARGLIAAHRDKQAAAQGPQAAGGLRAVGGSRHGA